jgi:hypothetical protein
VVHELYPPLPFGDSSNSSHYGTSSSVSSVGEQGHGAQEQVPATFHAQSEYSYAWLREFFRGDDTLMANIEQTVGDDASEFRAADQST